MKVLMISGDKNMLVPGTEAFERLQLQRAQVEQLDVFVWPQVHSVWEIRKAARARHYDVITAQDPFWRGHMAWHLLRLNRARLNIQVHTDLSHESWWRRVWAHFNLSHATSVRVVSERAKRQVETYTKAPVHILPVFIDCSRFQHITHEPHAQKTILWVGRFEAEKDPLYAVQMLKDLRKKGIEAKLIMLGSGSLEGTIRETAKNISVELPGWQDVVPYLKIADVVLSTSRYESWGASMIEALAAGVPVVAPDVGVAREAGAIVGERAELTSLVIDVLQKGTRGELKLSLLSREEWARKWPTTL